MRQGRKTVSASPDIHDTDRKTTSLAAGIADVLPPAAGVAGPTGRADNARAISMQSGPANSSAHAGAWVSAGDIFIQPAASVAIAGGTTVIASATGEPGLKAGPALDVVLPRGADSLATATEMGGILARTSAMAESTGGKKAGGLISSTGLDFTDAARSGSGAAASKIVPSLGVTGEAGLNAAIAAADGDPANTGAITIDISGAIDLTSGPLTEINLASGNSLTIAGTNGSGGGQSQTLDGGGTQRGLFIYAGTVKLENLALNDMTARGGNGGNGAGGGAGLGGALLVGGASKVILDNVTFSGDAAVGGDGAPGSPPGSGGGGGLGAGGAPGSRGAVGGSGSDGGDFD